VVRSRRLVFKFGLVIPYLLDVVFHIGRQRSSGSVNRKLRIKALCRLSALVSRLALQSLVQRRRLPAAAVGLPVVESESAFLFLGFVNSEGYAMDLLAKFVLLRDTA